jgi:opacity protein-like surface antigen
MRSREKLIGIAVLAALAMSAAPAFSQVEEARHEVHLYGGQSFGDDLTDRTVSGRVPKLDDGFTYGFRYGYTVTRNFGLELSVGETATSATHLRRTGELVPGEKKRGNSAAQQFAELHGFPPAFSPRTEFLRFFP